MSTETVKHDETLAISTVLKILLDLRKSFYVTCIKSKFSKDIKLRLSDALFKEYYDI